MIDKRFLGEWISEESGDRLDFHWSTIRVVGKVYLLNGICGTLFDSSRWFTNQAFSLIIFTNEIFGTKSFEYEFRNKEDEVHLFEIENGSLYSILRRVE